MVIHKKRYEYLAVTASFFFTAGMLAGCGQGAQSTGGENRQAAEESVSGARTALTVGFDAEFPPYGYLDENGEYVGFDLDLAAEVCARNGWELVKQPIDWAAKDMELSGGSIDCIWNGFTINGRETAYTWSEPYVDNSQVFAVAAGSGITSKADLAGKNIAVQKDSSALAALNEEDTPENIALRDSFASLVEYADYNTAFMDLEQGAVDAVAMDIGVARYQIEKREAGAYAILEEQLSGEQYGVGFLLGNEALRDVVQDTLNAMAEDGTFMAIAEKWNLQDSVCLGK
jgi:polar amino acid transport system substrate-binding protein